ncbi:hypothetical protein PO883_06110 [Massilia sp. DJPM01]|uniref:hypothetical protein n=1 Tax=Massilia sp. DJPM01 TaxID=3024404 RepID=UPI00259ED271|nr:hypothetical protein [Massilia sp. DJPM01]MDM5176769.1 hypothetical protein [Massilia sp. DJPM01]
MLAISLTSTLNGCLPLAADDFTVMGKDVLSDLLRNSYSTVNLTPGNAYGTVGVGRIDKSKVEVLANNLFVAQKRNDIQEIFAINAGVCRLGVTHKELICTFIRKWKLKNSWGGPGTENWSDPAAKVEIIFIFNELERLKDLSIEIIDVTEKKEIKG